MPHLNRRQFLTAGALGTATWAVQARADTLDAVPWNAGKARSLKKAQDPVPTVCVACEARCPILAYRDNGRVVQVSPNPAAGPAASICARAYEQIEALYDSERILQPMARVGRRGENRWQVIRWAEAIERIRLALSQSPHRALVEMGRPDPLAQRVLSELGVTHVAGWRSALAQAQAEAQAAVYGAPLASPELSNVRTVLLVGARPWDNSIRFAPLAKALAQAKLDGAEVISLSPYQGSTGSVADRWLPIRPGSEAELLLGLAHRVLNASSLDQGRLASEVDATLEDIRGELAPYADERVAASTGLTKQELAWLAQRIAARGPALVLAESGSAEDTVPLEAASALLTAVGGGVRAGCLRAAVNPSDLPAGAPELSIEQLPGAMADGHRAIPLYLAYRSNPVYRSTDSATRGAFADESRVKLLVALDTHLTETARLADLVLPAAADLELWNLFGGCTESGRGTVILQQPTPRGLPEASWLREQRTNPTEVFDGPPNRPLGEARQLGDVLLDLLGPAGSAPRLAFGHATVAEYVAATATTLSGSPGLARDGIRPCAQGRIDADPQATTSAPILPLKVQGRLAVAAPAPGRSPDNNFALIVLQEPVLDSGFANSYWAREIRHRNPVYLNPVAAKKLGIEKGDRVWISSPAGRVSAEAQPLEGIHPEAIALADDFGHWAGGAAAVAIGESGPAVVQPRPITRQELLRGAAAVLTPAPLPDQSPWWSRGGAGTRATALGHGVRVSLERDRG